MEDNEFNFLRQDIDRKAKQKIILDILKQFPILYTHVVENLESLKEANI